MAPAAATEAEHLPAAPHPRGAARPRHLADDEHQVAGDLPHDADVRPDAAHARRGGSDSTVSARWSKLKCPATLSAFSSGSS